MNRSINETLPRMVMTSATTLVTLISLATIGGEVIRPFAMVLILGVLIETHNYRKRKAWAEAAHVS